MARSHEEAVGVDVKGGEASERTRTGNNEEHRARERIDDGDSETALDKSMMKPLTPPTHTQNAQGRRGQWVHCTTRPTSCLESKKVAGWPNSNPKLSACQLRGGVVKCQLTALTKRSHWVTARVAWRRCEVQRSREVDMEVDEIAATARRMMPATSHDDLR